MVTPKRELAFDRLQKPNKKPNKIEIQKEDTLVEVLYAQWMKTTDYMTIGPSTAKISDLRVEMTLANVFI